MTDKLTARAGGECPGCGLDVLVSIRVQSLYDMRVYDHPTCLICPNCRGEYLKGKNYERKQQPRPRKPRRTT